MQESIRTKINILCFWNISFWILFLNFYICAVKQRMLLVNLKSSYCLCIKVIIRELICYLQAESIEWFILDQAFSLSYDLASLPPSPISRQQVVSLSQTSRVSPHRSNLRAGAGKRERGRRQFIRKRDLVLYKSFISLLPSIKSFFGSVTLETVPQIQYC